MNRIYTREPWVCVKVKLARLLVEADRFEEARDVLVELKSWLGVAGVKRDDWDYGMPEADHLLSLTL